MSKFVAVADSKGGGGGLCPCPFWEYHNEYQFMQTIDNRKNDFIDQR